MNNSLRDQLKALGLAKVKTEPDHSGSERHSRSTGQKRKVAVPQSPATELQEISLARAYAARVAAEQEEAAALKRQQEEKARIKRERKRVALELLQGKCLRKPDAEISRYFEYGKKIRRIHVDAEQLQALNSGMLGIAQIDGKFLLVPADVIVALRQRASEFVALYVQPGSAEPEDTTVPPDLHW